MQVIFKEISHQGSMVAQWLGIAPSQLQGPALDPPSTSRSQC